MKNKSLVSRWLVLTRYDCSLCEIFISELVDLLGDQVTCLKVCDITGEGDLEQKYGHRIPVLLIDDEFVCAYRVDRERLQSYLDA